MSRFVAAGMIVGQLALACPSAALTSAQAQTFGGMSQGAAASVDLSAYTPTSGLAAVVQANAPVQPADVTAAIGTAQAGAKTYTDGAVSGLNTSLMSDTSVTAFGQRMAALGVLAPPSQVSAAVSAALAQVAAAGYLTQAGAAATYVTPAQVTTISPPTTVNGASGAVTIPVYVRQITAAPITLDSSGSATFTFPVAFKNTPSCFVELATAAATYVYSLPQTTAKSLTSVSVTIAASMRTITINSVGVASPVWAAPPSGSTAINISCSAPG